MCFYFSQFAVRTHARLSSITPIHFFYTISRIDIAHCARACLHIVAETIFKREKKNAKHTDEKYTVALASIRFRIFFHLSASEHSRHSFLI